MNGKMSAKVYDISGSATAVGREPIVCVELIDSVNGNALVAQRYLKVKMDNGRKRNWQFRSTRYCSLVKVKNLSIQK